MERTWLIQRLLRPYKQETPLTQLGNAFSFGGGLVNGGLSKEAFQLVNKVFRFDYMGAAEYEWGEVPKALAKIYDEKDQYCTFRFDCTWENVEVYKRSANPRKKAEIRSGSTTVYVLCHKAYTEQVMKIIEEQSKDGYGKCKMYANVKEGLSGLSYREDLVGWLELDNGFMFFSDKEMFEKTCELFSIEPCTKEVRV